MVWAGGCRGGLGAARLRLVGAQVLLGLGRGGTGGALISAPGGGARTHQATDRGPASKPIWGWGIWMASCWGLPFRSTRSVRTLSISCHSQPRIKPRAWPAVFSADWAIIRPSGPTGWRHFIFKKLLGKGGPRNPRPARPPRRFPREKNGQGWGGDGGKRPCWGQKGVGDDHSSGGQLPPEGGRERAQGGGRREALLPFFRWRLGLVGEKHSGAGALNFH